MVSLCNLAAANHFHIDFDFMPELNLLRLYFHSKNPIMKLNQTHPRILSLTSSVKKPALTLFIISELGYLCSKLPSCTISSNVFLPDGISLFALCADSGASGL